MKVITHYNAIGQCLEVCLVAGEAPSRYLVDRFTIREDEQSVSPKTVEEFHEMKSLLEEQS